MHTRGMGHYPLGRYYLCAVRQIRCPNCKPHLACTPQIVLRIQGYGGYWLGGNTVGLGKVKPPVSLVKRDLTDWSNVIS